MIDRCVWVCARRGKIQAVYIWFVLLAGCVLSVCVCVCVCVFVLAVCVVCLCVVLSMTSVYQLNKCLLRGGGRRLEGGGVLSSTSVCVCLRVCPSIHLYVYPHTHTHIIPRGLNKSLLSTKSMASFQPNHCFFHSWDILCRLLHTSKKQTNKEWRNTVAGIGL